MGVSRLTYHNKGFVWMVESRQPQEPSDLFIVPKKVWPFSLPILSGKTSRFSMPKLKIFLFLAISFVMLTTAFGHNSSVYYCSVFSSLNTHVTWSVASHPRVPEAARHESSSGVKPKSEKDNTLMASVSSLLFSTSNCSYKLWNKLSRIRWPEKRYTLWKVILNK